MSPVPPPAPRRARRPRGGRLACVAAALLASGCATPPGADPVNPVPPPPSYDELASAQNQRIEKLDTIYSGGVMEIRWTGEDGEEHFEPQVNVDLWVDMPRHTALRLEKLGDVLFWLGSDADRFWLFDRMGEEQVLYSWPHEFIVHFEAAAISVRPLVLLDLMGLTTLPPTGGTVEIDPDRGAWLVRCSGRGGPVRIAFDPATRLPIAVDALDEDGAVVAGSRLDRYTPVRQVDGSSLEFPLLAEIVRISNPERTSDVELFLSEPDDGDGQPFDRVFDLPRLRRSMPPDRIEGDLAPSPVATP
ncbi:MAG: hypothetical protein ACYTGG_04590 [Planctomycetota bacterium]|jgi:hypothetical protein